MKVPPGVSPQDFSDALKQFEDIVGKDWVFTSDADVAMYRDAYSPFYGEKEELVASAAVAPDNVEDVQKIVKVANTYKIPIYPISTGKNLGYGGSAPAYSGSVVLDLKRMNRDPGSEREAMPTRWSSRASAISISIATSRKRD